MAYNLTRKAVERQIEVLNRMRKEQGNFTISARSPLAKAQRIREALKAAQAFEDFNVLYGHLKDSYTIKVGKKTIIFEWSGKFSTTVNTADGIADEALGEILRKVKRGSNGEAPSVQEPAPLEVSEPSPERPRSIVPGVTDLLQVISASVRLAEEAELLYPDANLSNDEKLKLFNWAETRNWKFIDHEGAGLTLTKKEVDDLLLWEPPQ